MIQTLTLILYLIMSLAGIYVSISYYNKEYIYRSHTSSQTAGTILTLLLFIIIFLLFYIKHIIVSYFIFWFIFDLALGIISTIQYRNYTSIKITPLRGIFNLVCGVISCFGVLYILI